MGTIPTLESSYTDPYNLLIIAPIFSAYILGSVTGLRTWLAVQELPLSAEANTLAVASETQPLLPIKPKSRKAELLPYIGFVLFATAVHYEIAGYVVIALVYPAFAWLCTTMFRELTGTPMAYHRTVQGDLLRVTNMTALSKSARVTTGTAIVILSVCLPTGAIWYNSAVCASAMFFVAVFVYQGRQGWKTISMRKLVVQAAEYELGIVAYLGLIGAIVWWILRNQETSEPTKGLGGAIFAWVSRNGDTLKPTTSIIDEPSFDSVQWIYMLWPTLFLSNMLPAIFRFDYANHAQVTQSSTPIVAITAVPAPAAGGLTAGALAPSWAAVLRVPFRHYYFGAAMAAWMCSNFIVYLLITREILPDFGRLAYTIYLLLISTPLIVGAVFSIGLVRGETKSLWMYEEIWMAEPTATEAAAAVKPAVSAESEEAQEKVNASMNV
ncbi:hypothetical protein HWV62_27087 [Athelia sp. TMB]|nr:hypothetical protein HWV62_27087 [Athelia sp. TMB]